MPKKLNLIGKKFGMLTVIKKSEEKGKHSQVKWLCHCECGNEKIVYSYSLTSGRTKSCGCMQYKQRGEAVNKINLLNKKFGKLTVIATAPTKNKTARWLCRCECGNEKIIIGSKLRSGETKSCGCLRHVAYNWKGYEEISGNYWRNIKRHAAEKNRIFTINIEQAWEKFINQDRKCALSGIPLCFSRDTIRKKDQTASLDRIDNSLGYTLENTQWIHQELNFMKNKLLQNKFINWCKIVTDYQSNNVHSSF